MRRARLVVRKMKAKRAPRRPIRADHIAWSFIGGCLGILLLAWLTKVTGNPFLIAPFGATCVLLFAAPESPLAQPRAVIGGHLLAAVIATALLLAAGGAWWAPPLGVGLTIGAMALTHTTHPPAGADPLLILLLPGQSAPALFLPIVGGAVCLVLLALVFNNLARGRRYPTFW
jgi:CBS-domain-containing membrane protein